METMKELSAGAQALLTYIREHDWVTYVEVERVLTHYLVVSGDYEILHPTIDNLVFWSGVSEAFVAVVNELFERGLVWRVPAEYLSYMIDGKVLRLPIPKRVQKRYGKPSWIPTCFRPIERISAADRKKYGTHVTR